MTHRPATASLLQCWALACTLAFAGNAFAQADNCEGIRAQIESKIAASGVTQFTVAVVDANDTGTKGQTVGTCALGTRRIVYSRAAESAAPSGAATTAPRGSAPMLTECRDGSSPVNGICPK